MPFEVIPAIDVSAGRLVRVSGGAPVPLDAHGGDPVAAAAAFVAAGATRLHVVDVDLAARDRPTILGEIGRIAQLGVPIQASGGATEPSHVEAFLAAGADRVVLGSRGLASPDGVRRLLETFGDRVCVGIEAEGPTIRPRDSTIELPLWDALGWLTELPVPRYLFTELRRSGELAGPDLDGIWALATHTARPVIAAGGIRSSEDVVAVAALGDTVQGAVIGRALYDGLDLAEAMRAVGARGVPERS